MNAANAGVPGAELFPGQARLLVLAAVSNGLQALRVGGGTAVDDRAASLLAPQPGASFIMANTISKTVTDVRFQFFLS
jgi:hypothetical protein